MSVDEVYNPKFEDFHGRAMVTWRVRDRPVRIDENLMEQYKRWSDTKLAKDEPPAVFWETKGPAIVRALRYCGAFALVLEYAGVNKVTYVWFARHRDDFNGRDTYRVCAVSAEGGFGGSDTRVRVTLPTDEDVVFMFHGSQMKRWLRPEPEPEPKLAPLNAEGIE